MPESGARPAWASVEAGTAVKAVPEGPDWLHEIKYDDHRLRVERQGRDVGCSPRVATTGPAASPWIVEAALKNREQHFVIDGEAVVLGVDGVSDLGRVLLSS